MSTLSLIIIFPFPKLETRVVVLARAVPLETEPAASLLYMLIFKYAKGRFCIVLVFWQDQWRHQSCQSCLL